MQNNLYTAKIINELMVAAGGIDEKSAETLADQIVRARKVFVAGAGRSGLMTRAAAMRLMQMGFEVYVVGETVTPQITKDDLLIIGSGSGETKSLLSMALKAKNMQASVALVTIYPDSSIGKLADVTVKLPGAPKDQNGRDQATIQPMGSLFEQTLLLFFDALILRLMEKLEIAADAMFARHANLE